MKCTACLPGYYRVGKDLFFSRDDEIVCQKANIDVLGGKAKKTYDDFDNHLTPMYLSGILANGTEWKGTEYKSFYYWAGILCPVDVEIYDKEGHILGRVSDNQVDESIKSELMIIVDEDRKWILLPDQGEYSVKLTGTDDGYMTFGVQQ